MNNLKTLAATTLIGALLLSGCVSKTTEKEQYSGFLPNYAVLKEASSPSGYPVMRWIAPNFKPRSYNTVVFDKLELYPAPQPNDRINTKTLKELQDYASSTAKAAISSNYKVIQSNQSIPPNGRAMIIKAAITGVSTSNEGMKWYEVVPVAAVVGATSAATGHRDQHTELYIEASITDAATGKPMAYVVRKVFGRMLENDQQTITANDFKAAIKEMNNDLSIMLSK